MADETANAGHSRQKGSGGLGGVNSGGILPLRVRMTARTERAKARTKADSLPGRTNKEGMTTKRDDKQEGWVLFAGLKSMKDWVKNSSTFLLTSSACSITVGWPELGTIQSWAWGMF